MDKALRERVEKQAWFHKHPRGLPLLLLVVVGFATILSIITVELVERQADRLALERNFTEIAHGLQRRTAEHAAMLIAAASLFAMNDNVSAGDFNDFALELLELEKEERLGSRGVAWAPRLDAADVQDFEDLATAKTGMQFNIHPRPQAEQGIAVPILYMAPMSTANRMAIGYDLYAGATAREAISRATRLQQSVVSGKVNLNPQRAGRGAEGFLMIMPVFRRAGGDRTVIGYVYSPLLAEQFLDAAARLSRDRPIEITIYDRYETPENLLVGRNRPAEGRLSITRSIDVGSRDWIIRVSSDRKILSPLSLMILVFGTTVTLMVVGIAWLINKHASEDRKVLEWLVTQSSIRDSLMRELNHRVKNTLANVLSIISLTRRRTNNIDTFADGLLDRIRSMSATHDLLSQNDWKDALLNDVIARELAPYMQGGETRVQLDGPPVRLAPNDAMTLGLVIHELANNAAKFGALTTDEGSIAINWKLTSPELVQLSWREHGGPQVKPPSRRGLGRDLIEKIAAHELQEKVSLEFKPEGVECELAVPVRKPRTFSLRNSAVLDSNA